MPWQNDDDSPMLLRLQPDGPWYIPIFTDLKAVAAFVQDYLNGDQPFQGLKQVLNGKEFAESMMSVGVHIMIDPWKNPQTNTVHYIQIFDPTPEILTQAKETEDEQN